MNILGIETSCDETAAAIVSDGRHVLSSVINSQVKLHAPYGGVVPEIASRSHVAAIPSVIEEALKVSGLGWGDVDGIAVTYGPGLASSLLVGLSAAKALAMRLDKPLYGINHLEAHIYSVFLGEGVPRFEEMCPFLALIVSGGHTCVVKVEGLGEYRLLGQTIDDAAGEAFDKGSNLLGLGYPGGPAIDKASAGGDNKFVNFPRGRPGKGKEKLFGLDAELCFSFSGLKTALLYYLRDNPINGDENKLASVAASYQEAIVDALVKRCDAALNGEGCLIAGGGVSLNKRLREKLAKLADRRKVELMLAEPRYCGDNASMIAGLAGAGRGISGSKAMQLEVVPNLPVA